jgi:hypothetical protein
MNFRYKSEDLYVIRIGRETDKLRSQVFCPKYEVSQLYGSILRKKIGY